MKTKDIVEFTSIFNISLSLCVKYLYGSSQNSQNIYTTKKSYGFYQIICSRGTVDPHYLLYNIYKFCIIYYVILELYQNNCLLVSFQFYPITIKYIVGGLFSEKSSTDTCYVADMSKQNYDRHL